MGCVCMSVILNRVAVVLALVLPLAAGLSTPASADIGDNRPVNEPLVRAMQYDQAAFRSGASRVTALSQMRPMARDAAVTVATRNVDPGVLTALRKRENAPAAPVGKLDVGTLDAMPRVNGDAQWQCLAEAIYFESRGEPLAGQIAVAEVVLNRVDDSGFPKTVCGVTRQGAGSGRGCQFSYACDGRSDAMKSAVSRDRSEKLARLMLDGRARTVTDGATYFHTRSVRPDWSRKFTRTTAIGHHLFYRAATRVAGN